MINGVPHERAQFAAWTQTLARRVISWTGAKPMRGRILTSNPFTKRVCLCEFKVQSSDFEFYSKSCTNLTAATWLILPVVICLSQRLSHACLSISIIQRNCRRLIKTVMVYLMVHCYLDNRSNSRANTCTKERLTKLCIY